MHVLLSGLSNDRVELNLAAALQDAGVELTGMAKPDCPAAELFSARQIPFRQAAFRHRFDLQAAAIYREILRDRSIDLIHCFTNRALSIALMATRYLPDAPPIIAYRGTMGHLHRWDPASRLSYLHPRLRAIVCVSEAVRAYLVGMGVPAGRLTTIWKGHDPSWYTPAPREALQEFGFSDDAIVVGFAGNIRPVKGVDVLLRAFETIPLSSGIHLLIIGAVRDRRIQRAVGRQPNVCFAGFREDAAALIGACDLAVMPSVRREGLSKAVIEAMAQGVPPIVTRVGGMPECVTDGASGLVVPPNDPAALHDAIRELANDPARRRLLGEAALLIRK